MPFLDLQQYKGLHVRYLGSYFIKCNLPISNVLIQLCIYRLDRFLSELILSSILDRPFLIIVFRPMRLIESKRLLMLLMFMLRSICHLRIKLIVGHFTHLISFRYVESNTEFSYFYLKSRPK